MARRAQSRLYSNRRTIQATLLPLFESYSAEPDFAKLDDAMGPLRKLPKDLKVLQDQFDALHTKVQELEVLCLFHNSSHNLNTAEVQEVVKELDEVAAIVREEAQRAEYSMTKTIDPDVVSTVQELLVHLRNERESVEEQLGRLSQELDSIRLTDPQETTTVPGPHEDYGLALLLLTLLFIPMLVNKCLGT